ncbi:MAG: DNA adenine methylase [Gemmatimonadales bacterium]
MIKYIGSKRTLVPRILAYTKAIRERTGAATFCDLFTGTTRVAQAVKRAHFQVTANDLASYSEILAIAYVEADAEQYRGPLTAAKLGHLNALPGRDGYFTQTFCVDSRYFQPGNGRRIDAIREEIERIADDRVERAILLTSLLEAADRVDSTTGLQMAYLKEWAPRSFNAMELRMPLLIAGAGVASREDANTLAAAMAPVDIAYLDPPYNQHSYYSNYHIWETLVRNDTPESYGVARKRIDCRVTKSDYNAKGRSWAAFESLVRTVPAKHLIVSFSNEGYFAHDDLVTLLESTCGEVEAVPVDFRRYVGAQIGIHNPHGEKVGRVSHLTNREYLFVAGPDAGRIVQDATLSMAGAAPLNDGKF